ncbi:exodeoxyribonuclease-3 [Persephonella hydrogeniphila]|uniref:Exodeoxyribonuclease-3 n=1 Tax=Persephonella hydrogeniphila TaxID=198703 RepID=A0A285MZL2_9AQUI|nr:exodeoxyribonuclease III [Persephonella hydrogeniphila]SNZ02635.1 exodeoxyribonuclease-3 [Persephonella hydrogeniphila]
MGLKVCSFNVNSIRARKELILKWLQEKEKNIDILCLQEVKVQEELFPYKDFEEIGYKAVVYSQKAYNGVAVLLRRNIDHIIKGIGDEYFDQQKRVLSVKTGDLWIINVYAPHGDLRGEDKYYYKLDWYRRFSQFLKDNFSPEEKIIMVGDFNVAIEDKDVWNPELLKDSIGTMPEEREAFRNILNWGFVDCFRYLYPDKKQFTWWDYIGGAVWRDEGMRIDYILATKPVVEHLKDIYVDTWTRKRRKPTPSDHAPVIGLFEGIK